MRKFFSEKIRTSPFECFNKLMNSHLRRTRNKQMNMVWHYFKCKNINLFFLSNLIKDSHKPFFNLLNKYRSPSLWTPNEMIVYEVDLIL